MAQFAVKPEKKEKFKIPPNKSKSRIFVVVDNHI